MDLKIILGPPGTGKTTRLLDIMEKELASGIEPTKMVFCSFTKKAAEEAIERATERFNFTKKDMVYFKTIHSLAFQALGLKRTEVMQTKNYQDIGEHLGLKFTTKADAFAEITPGCKNAGDQYSFIDSFSRARRITAKEVWDIINHDNLNWFEFERYSATLQEYKKMYNLYDFQDMLELGSCEIDVDIVIIDEAQDLSTSQWYFLRKIMAKAKRVYIGGDDDQAIFSWSGADVEAFLGLKGEVEQLTQSWRIPRKVHALAQDLTSKIKHRKEKHYSSMDREGSVEYWNAVDHIDFTEGTWLLLARNAYLLPELGAAVRTKGIAYSVRGKSAVDSVHMKAIEHWERQRSGVILSPKEKDVIKEFLPRDGSDMSQHPWHEAFTRMPVTEVEYYLSLRRRGETLTGKPRINISTIHGVKGGESDHVVLLTDMAGSTFESQSLDPDAEHRVWYVGATRCKNSLHIIMPRGRFHYNL
jgi:DNA helicase-2/ATP-dependent DNA helicase PcrA